METVFVDLIAEFRDGKPVYERVPAILIGDKRYRLTASPGFAPGFASGDEIETAPDEKLGHRIIKRSGNICLQLFLGRCSITDREQIASMFQHMGGWLDGGFDGDAGCLLIFTVPIKAGFVAIERVMEEIAQSFPIDRWLYGNVYDSSDGVTPLSWWKDL